MTHFSTDGSVTTPNAPHESRLRRGLWWLIHLAAWLVVLSLGAVALSRIYFHDATFFLIWLNAFTRYVYLPAYACLLWALWQRRWGLVVASGLVVACHIRWIAPDFLRDTRFDPPAASTNTTLNDSPHIRIFFANVAARNTEHDAMLREIAAADPDVLVLVEYSWPWHLKLKTSPVMAPYIFGTGHLQSHIGSVNVFSKRPLKTETQNWTTGRAVHTIDIELGSQTLRIIGLHGPRPMDDPLYDYRGYWQKLIPMLTSQQGPLLIVGDCNATQHSLVYQQLTSGRLRSAHDDRGRGYAATWPNGENWLPPIRIDQAFVSPEVECERIVEGRGLGSDHKPLVVDVRIRGGAGVSR